MRGLTQVFQRTEGYDENVCILIAKKRCEEAGAEEVEFQEIVEFDEKSQIYQMLFLVTRPEL